MELETASESPSRATNRREQCSLRHWKAASPGFESQFSPRLLHCADTQFWISILKKHVLRHLYRVSSPHASVKKSQGPSNGATEPTADNPQPLVQRPLLITLFSHVAEPLSRPIDRHPIVFCTMHARTPQFSSMAASSLCAPLAAPKGSGPNRLPTWLHKRQKFWEWCSGELQSHNRWASPDTLRKHAFVKIVPVISCARLKIVSICIGDSYDMTRHMCGIIGNLLRQSSI